MLPRRPPAALVRTVLFLLSALALAAAAPPSVEDLFAAPDIRLPRLSPDGSRVAFLTKLGTGRIGLALVDLARGTTEPLVVAKHEDIGTFFWKGNGTIVYGGDVGGNESIALWSINLQTRRSLALAESVARGAGDVIDVLSVQRDDPRHFLVLGRCNGGSFGVVELDAVDATRSKITGAFDPLAYNFVADHTGTIRSRDRLSAGKILHELRSDAHRLFRAAAETPADIGIVSPAWRTLAFAADNRTAYVLARAAGADTSALHAYDTVTRTLGPSLFAPPAGEITEVLFNNDHSKLLGVVFVSDRTHVHWFDAARAKLVANLAVSLPTAEVRLVSESDDEQVFVVASTSDRQPPLYHILNLRPDSPRPPGLALLGASHAKLVPASLAATKPVVFTARDGLAIHGYLTLPPGTAPGERVPLVIHPHGGPFGLRDDGSFNPEVQFLATRGYAVLQPNFRGSGGYGLKFLLAGRREWGGKMQDDLSDAVQWAVAQGVADPARVAIFGASYGGYAALAGVTFTPELYCCAVNYLGITDLGLFTSWSRNFGSERLYETHWVGEEKAYLRERSPVNFAARIRVPTLHGYGVNDPRVDLKNWTRLKTQLDRHGKTYEFTKEKNEGHGFKRETTRIAFYRRAEAFLAKYLAFDPTDQSQ